MKKATPNKKKMTAKEFEAKVYADISAEIITQLKKVIESGDEGALKWIKSWSSSEPQNYVTGKKYRGYNWLFLSMTGHTYLISDKQLHDWNVKHFGEEKEKYARKKENAKSITIFYYSTSWKKKVDIEDEDEEKQETVIRTRPFLRAYTMYDIRDIDGLPQPEDRKAQNHDERISIAEGLFRTWGEVVPIEFGYDSAFYSPSQDKICVPEYEQFVGAPNYYGVLGHESVHSTGAKNRLNRPIENKFGSKNYAREELIAEIGGLKLANLFGFAPKLFSNTVAYLRSWISALKDDVKALYIASTRADKAVELMVKNYNERRLPTEPEILMESVKELETKVEEPVEEPKEEPVVEPTEEEKKATEVAKGIKFNPVTQTVSMSEEEFNSMVDCMNDMKKLLDEYAKYVDGFKKLVG